MSIENLEFDNGKSRHTMMDCVDSVTEYVTERDWRTKANANTGYSAAGLINNVAGKAVANFWLDKVYTAKEGAAHRNGDYHIHDLDSPCGYCCGHDLYRLLNEGFNGVSGRVASRPPKHFREALYQMANFVGILQAEWAGAQAFSSFDTYLAPHVFFDKNYEGMTDNEVKQALVNFIYNLNVPSRWGQCVKNSYKCLKANGLWANYEDLKVGEEIYVVDPKTGELKKDILKSINVFDAPKKMHRYSNKHGFSFEVTDKHRVIYKTGSNAWIIKESHELLGKNVDIPIVSWEKINADWFMGDEYDISDEMLEFITFIMCDGCIVSSENRTKRLEFYKTDGRFGWERFEELCEMLGITYTMDYKESKDFGSSSRRYRPHGSEVVQKVISLLGGDKHKMPEFFSKLSPRQALIVIDAWVLLDGSFDGQHWRMQADNREIQEMLAYLSVKARKAVSISSRLISNNKTETKYTNIYKRTCRSCVVEEVDSTCDKVWCPTTDTGTFICMTDDGYVFVTGNSPFSNVTIDLFVPNDLKTQLPTRGDVPFFLSIYEEYQKANPDKVAEDNPSWKRLVDALRERLNDHESSVEDLFMNVTYAHFQPELELIDKMFYTVLNEGDDNGQPFTFPIPTINVTEDFDWDSEIADVIFESTGKFGYSYFQNFLGSQYKRLTTGELVKDENAYTPDAVRSMCPLTPDTKVLVRSSGETTSVSIGQIWNRAIISGVEYESFYNGVWSPCRAVKMDPQPVYKIEMANNDVVRMGELHLQPILRDGKEMTVKAMDLRVGDYIPYNMSVVDGISDDARQNFCQKVKSVDGKQYSIIESIEVDEKYSDHLYCLEVESEEHLFTLKSGMITHNCRLQLDKRELRKRGGGLFGSDAQTGCYSEDTEVLTRDGWKFFKDVSFDDEFYTLTADRKIELHHPINIFKYDYEGDLLNFKSKTLDLLVTPNHNMPLTHNGTRKIYWKKAEDCNHTFNLPIYGELQNQGEEYHTFRNGETKVKSSTWAKFMGLFISEGSTTGSKSGNDHPHAKVVVITQSKACNISAIDEVMNEMPFTVVRKERKNGRIDWTIYSAILWEEIKMGPSWEKRIPKYMFGMSKENLRFLFDYLMLGDGHIKKCSFTNYPERYYYTSSKGLADDVQHLAGLLGFSSNLTDDTERQKNRKKIIRGREIAMLHPAYSVSIHYSYNRNIKNGYTKVPYKGYVYCVEVPNHIVFVRRNGKSVWCGNSIGVVTINLARLGFTCKGDKKKLYKKLDELLNMAKSTLEKKRKFITEMNKRGLYPYTNRYVRTLDTFFSTIGVNGGNEMVRNFTNDKEDITTEYGKAFAVEVLEHIRSRIKDFQEETGNLYNLEATPAEGCFTFDTRVATLDGDKKIGEIVGSENQGIVAKDFHFEDAPLQFNFARDIRATGIKEIYEIAFESGLVINASKEHPFGIKTVDENGKVEHHWETTETLRQGMIIFGARQVNEKSWEEIEQVVSRVERTGRFEEVYNFENPTNHNYYVGDKEHGYVLVHNCTYRFALADKKKFGEAIIQAGTKDQPYYTNSTQVPANYTSDPFEALDLQDDLQTLYTGGTVAHLYMSEPMEAQSCKNLVRTVLTNYRLPYISITPSFSICPVHGYIKGHHDHCPICDQEIIKRHKNELS